MDASKLSGHASYYYSAAIYYAFFPLALLIAVLFHRNFKEEYVDVVHPRRYILRGQ